MEKQKFTKEYLLKQIQDCQSVINKNIGVIELCKWQIENMDLDDKVVDGEKSV